MKAYQRYAKLIMAQHLAKIQFIAEHTNCEACDISTAMTALLNAYEFESSANSEYSKTKFFSLS